tara:strand:+ start:3591 stop:5195 length:1605 start_codon:yes stop_codon:yes gene_type:complete
MNKFRLIKEPILFGILIFYSAAITIYTGNRGLFPIDTFTFFDSGYNITIGKHPIKDFWIISGIVGDYLQGAFFKIFGFNWTAYLLHSSLLNIFITVLFFVFLRNFEKNNIENLIFALSMATLCYPVVGTPFTYLHSYIFSLSSVIIFCAAILQQRLIYFFLLPFFMFLSFLSMQLPSSLINLLIISFLFLNYYFCDKDKKKLINFFSGFIICSFIFIFYLFYFEISVKSFIEQYILFPLSLGFERVLAEPDAFTDAKLINKLNFKNLFLDFKFIHFFFIPYLYLIIKEFIIDKDFIKTLSNYKIDIIVIFSVLIFIFHQLITANQIFIFSIIPFISFFLYHRVKQKYLGQSILKYLIILVLIFSTLKFHFRFNEDRKFMELQGVDFEKSIKASQLDKRFGNLKWITAKFGDNPQEEINLLIQSKDLISKENYPKMVITHYQFFSLIINDDLNIPNRWYFPNNTFPASRKNKFYDNYKEFLKEKIKNKKIKTLFIVMQTPESWANIYSDYFINGCKNYEFLNKITIKIDITNCKI